MGIGQQFPLLGSTQTALNRRSWFDSHSMPMSLEKVKHLLVDFLGYHGVTRIGEYLPNGLLGLFLDGFGFAFHKE